MRVLADYCDHVSEGMSDDESSERKRQAIESIRTVTSLPGPVTQAVTQALRRTVA
jgi:hypothetical protein